MHLIEAHDGDAAVRVASERIPFGAGFPTEIAEKTKKLEVHGSSFNDPGPDFCLYRAFDADGQMIGERQVNGY
jgi:hypothetical protein